MDGFKCPCGRTAAMWSALVAVLVTSTLHAQNIERYLPVVPLPSPEGIPEVPASALPPASEDDRVLVRSLDAIVILDDASKVSLAPTIDELSGLSTNFTSGSSVVHSAAFQSVVRCYLDKPMTLRDINALARDIAKHYRYRGQPIVDVQVPEQRITGGTLQLVIVETRIDDVIYELDGVFDCRELSRWVECTHPGQRVYESNLESDLFWLNQNPFRRVSVDFKPGSCPGTSDVIYRSRAVTPIRGYVGADDTGVDTLGYGRFFAGLTYGNFLGTGGILSYQYTADEDFRSLEAHSLSYSQPISREWSYQLLSSWAGVSPNVGNGLTQDGESWQVTHLLTRNLIRNAQRSRSVNFGVDFKSSDNNLEFAGSTVSNSNADLVQLRLGFDDFKRYDLDQYWLYSANVFVGPGGGATNAHSSAAFQTLRPGSSPDFIYGRIQAELSSLIGCDWLLRTRMSGQVSSERLLFSETLGLGGFDTIRGFDQRAYNADHGWLASFEFGPKTYRWGCKDNPKSLRAYAFTDLGNGYLSNPLPAEDAYAFAASTGIGCRYRYSDRITFRFDWAYGWETIGGGTRSNRAHFGLTWIPGPRP